ncbi:MAG TPA: hypothetical protein VGN80_19885 [Devosiaceae bacterium]|jgi:uncharacterized membrane protein|nr:hypothetical protein [Devosiaceae bacterium]
MYFVGLLLFVIHIVAFIAGGANSVVMPIIGSRLATATPEGRASLLGVADQLAKVGKVAMATLLVTGLLVLWLKWNFLIPNAWFWVKMLLIVAMIVLIAMNERSGKQARTGDVEAMKRSKLLGQLTAVAFAGVIVSAIFAFN